MRSWILMTVMGVGILAGTSSKGTAAAIKSAVKGISCYATCTTSNLKGYWGQKTLTLDQKKKLIDCMKCPKGANNFTNRLEWYLENGKDAKKTAFVCKAAERLATGPKSYPYVDQIDQACVNLLSTPAVEQYADQAEDDAGEAVDATENDEVS